MKSVNIGEIEGRFAVEVLRDGYHLIEKTLYGEEAKQYLQDLIESIDKKGDI